jgi:hypothetical protein
MTTAATPLSYNLYVTQIATMAVLQQTLSTTGTSPNSLVSSSDPSFQAIIPQMLNYAELRIQRDLDFLSTQNSKTYTLTPNSNILAIPQTDFVTIQTMQVTDGSGNVTPLLAVSKDYLQNIYPVTYTSTPSVPQYFAMAGGNWTDNTGGATTNNIFLGPWPDSNYTANVTGTSRQPSLNNYASIGSADTNYTFISEYLPDILIMASMIYISAYQRNFGRMNDDPQMAQSYESQYQALLRGAMVEEARKKFQSAAWSSYSPSQVASPTRG